MEYDSRLMMGKDLLSNAEGIALFSDLSWITDQGSYYSKSKKFDAKKEVEREGKSWNKKNVFKIGN